MIVFSRKFKSLRRKFDSANFRLVVYNRVFFCRQLKSENILQKRTTSFKHFTAPRFTIDMAEKLIK